MSSVDITLSVVVAAYNVEKYLTQCLDSFNGLVNSSRVEVLVIDDGSTDNTANIAERYVQQNPSLFHLLKKMNGGHGSALNAGIKIARGKYIKFVDGDDWVNTGDLDRLIELLAKNDVDLSLCGLTEVYEDSNRDILVDLPDRLTSSGILSIEGVSSPELDQYYRLHTLTIKRSLLIDNRITLPEHCFYVDYVLILESTAFAKTALFSALNVYRYRLGRSGQSVEWRNMIKRYDQHDRVLKICVDFYLAYSGEKYKRDFVERRTLSIINTQYNISLLFNPDRHEGRKLASLLRAYLKRVSKKLYSRSKKRYIYCMVLHILGVNYQGWVNINRRRGLNR
mgnify:CR=1 FL=1